jgi:phosphate transport system permease protein
MPASISPAEERAPDRKGQARLYTKAASLFANFGDKAFRTVCQVAALVVPVLVLLLIASLVYQSIPAFRQLGFRFFISKHWEPNKDVFGAWPFIYGTLATSAIAMVVAVPLGVGAAAFLSEIARGGARRICTFLIELLAAIPSVVYGFWGIFFLAPLVQKLFDLLGGPNRGGSGIFCAGLILAIMVLPYIAAISYDVCRAVPRSQREGALALGATRWQTIRSVVLPYARPGIVGACFLALGRALGETMAVVMLIGNSPQIDFSIFAVGYSIPSVIANELGTASSDLHRSALVELGLVLFGVTVLVNALARLLIQRVTRRVGSKSARLVLPSVQIRDRLPARLTDRLMTVVLGVCLVITLVPLFHILGYILIRGIPALNLAFFTHLPIDTPPGLANALVGSGMMVGLATLGAVPLGVVGAIYLAEYRTHRLVPFIRFVAELLGGVPSIVVGIFAFAMLVQPLGHYSGWAGSFALGVMMIPIVMRSAEESLKLVPATLRSASYALGASQAQTVRRVIVPAALPAIITGVFLAIARIAGETAPLLFTASSSLYWARSFNAKVPSLTYYTYFYATSSSGEERQQAWAAALVLLAIVMLLNVGIRLVTGRRQVQASRAD